ncbi:hypothetical protein DL93DRAFT_2233387 [Clavulina sp. PMI_390]|nr:hypothetical protein DL93DRAFT_2233387 [Clavulina sp. PMI_390]
MSVTEITSMKQLDELRQSNKVVVIGLLSRSGESHELLQFVQAEAHRAKELHKNIEFCKVDAERHREIAEHLKIHRLPGAVAFKNRQDIDTVEGFNLGALFEMMAKVALENSSPTCTEISWFALSKVYELLD